MTRNMNPGLIITHPGNAHFDDLFSTSLVIYKCSTNKAFTEIREIHRRTPSQEEMEDRSIWKLDIGGKFDPSVKQFDHHLRHLQSDTLTLTQRKMLKNCTFSLLLKEWGEWDKAVKIFKWLPTAVKWDVHGPKKVVEGLNISFGILSKLRSFIEQSILVLFQQKNIIKSSEPLFSLLYFIGKHFYEQYYNYFDLLSMVEGDLEFITIKGVPAIKYLENVEQIEIGLLKKVMSHKKEEKWGEGGIVICPNNRPPGSIGVMRYDDDERVDFRRIADYEHVIFSHSNGFFAVLEGQIDEHTIISYVKDAIR